MLAGHTVPSVVTGKPVAIGGSEGRVEATGRGVVTVAREALLTAGRQIPDSTVAIQGFGNVGAAAGDPFFTGPGARIVSVSDVRGAIHNPKGLDILKVQDYAKQNGTVVGYPEAEPIPAEEILLLPVTVLVPAALQNQITAANAGKVKAKFVVEGANGPTTPQADIILRDNGITVVPDVLANAGGVTVSYFEWVQGLQAFFWTEAEVNAKLEQIMVRAYAQVRDAAKKHDCDLRTAAYIVGVGRVAEATKLRGIYP